jgi:hypothetical protein
MPVTLAAHVAGRRAESGEGRQPSDPHLAATHLPIGAWMAIAAATGAALGSGGALAASPQPPTLQREVRRPFEWPPEPSEPLEPPKPPSDAASVTWPERDVRDPAPTVSVPFRVIRRGDAEAKTVPRADPDQTATPTAGASKPSGPDDWNQPLSEDW